MPHNRGDFALDQQGGLTSMSLHDLITLMILPIGTSGTNEIKYMKYTSKYILKLQLHQQMYGVSWYWLKVILEHGFHWPIVLSHGIGDFSIIKGGKGKWKRRLNLYEFT